MKTWITIEDESRQPTVTTMLFVEGANLELGFITSDRDDPQMCEYGASLTGNVKMTRQAASRLDQAFCSHPELERRGPKYICKKCHAEAKVEV